MATLTELADDIRVSSCCDVVLDMPEFDEYNENAPQNFGIYTCPKCNKDCEAKYPY